MSKKQQPFLPMFVGDFMAATLEWEGEERALYALLLMHQWAVGHLPAEVPKLARLVRYDQHTFERWWPTVAQKFSLIQVAGIGARRANWRLEQHRAKTLALSEKNARAGKKGAVAKWQKDGGRHPEQLALANANGGERHSSAIATTHGNPSHPIPSHPDPSQTVGTQDSKGSEGGKVCGIENSEGQEVEPKSFSGQKPPPKEPPSRRGGAAEPRNLPFEEILDRVEKLIVEFLIPSTDTSRLAQMGHLSTSQVETALKQLQDRGRLPAAGVAA